MPSTKVETKGEFKLKVETNPHFEQRIQKWTVPFAGADVSVVTHLTQLAFIQG